MSWEALEWAGRQRTRASSTQIVLYVLANAADPQGVAMGWWTGEEHWWKYLMDRTRLARGTLFKVMGELEKLGALILEWRHPEAGGKRRAIVRLNYACVIDQSSEGEKDSTSETIPDAPSITENESTTETQIESTSEIQSTQKVHQDDSIESTTETSKNPYKDSKTPNPLSGGDQVKIDPVLEKDLDDLAHAYPIPITDLPRLRKAMVARPPDVRRKIIAAAAAYGDFIRGEERRGRKRAVKDAHRWVASELWQGFTAAVERKEALGDSVIIPIASREGRALRSLAGIARYSLPIVNGKTLHRGQMTPKLLAMADIPDGAVWISYKRGSHNFGSWWGWIREVFQGGALPALSEIEVPWPWPPKSDGTVYDQDSPSTGPPDHVDGTLCTEGDLKEFAGE